jgi:hypothetical protein
MKAEDLDRLLASEPGIEPSATFAHAVMAAVRREVDTPPPLPFPWRRAAWGMATCALAGAAVGYVAIALGPLPDPAPIRDSLDQAWSRHGWATMAVLGSLALSWAAWAVPARLFGLRA